MRPTVLALLDGEVLDTRRGALVLQSYTEDLPLEGSGPRHQEHLHQGEHMRACFIGSGMEVGVCTQFCGCCSAMSSSVCVFFLCSGFININMFW